MRKLRNAFATLLVTAAAASLAYLAGDALLSGERSLPPGTDPDGGKRSCVRRGKPLCARACRGRAGNRLGFRRASFQRAFFPQRPLPSTPFSQLSQEDRLLYEELFSAITGFEEKAVFSVQDADRIERVFTVSSRITRRFFMWTAIPSPRGRWGEEILEVDFQAEYTLSRQETEERTTLVKKAADDILSALTDGMDDYEKLKLLYDRIVTGDGV